MFHGFFFKGRFILKSVLEHSTASEKSSANKRALFCGNLTGNFCQ